MKTGSLWTLIIIVLLVVGAFYFWPQLKDLVTSGTSVVENTIDDTAQ